MLRQLLFLFVISICLFACNRKTSTESVQNLDESCYLKPDPGPCRMAIKRYYYDSREKKCKEFIYGGCNGVVPFETLEACQKGCGCE